MSKIISIILNRAEMRELYFMFKKVGQEERNHYSRDHSMIDSIEVWKGRMSSQYSEFDDSEEFCLIFVDSEIDLLYSVLYLCNARMLRSINYDGCEHIKSKIMNFIDQYRHDNEYIPYFTPCEVPF